MTPILEYRTFTDVRDGFLVTCGGRKGREGSETGSREGGRKGREGSGTGWREGGEGSGTGWTDVKLAYWILCSCAGRGRQVIPLFRLPYKVVSKSSTSSVGSGDSLNP